MLPAQPGACPSQAALSDPELYQLGGPDALLTLPLCALGHCSHAPSLLVLLSWLSHT